MNQIFLKKRAEHQHPSLLWPFPCTCWVWMPCDSLPRTPIVTYWCSWDPRMNRKGEEKQLGTSCSLSGFLLGWDVKSHSDTLLLLRTLPSIFHRKGLASSTMKPNKALRCFCWVCCHSDEQSKTTHAVFRAARSPLFPSRHQPHSLSNLQAHQRSSYKRRS